MSFDNNQALSEARQKLEQLIQALKAGHQQDNLLPALEGVAAQLTSLSRHDHLTGALNRRALLAALDTELARSYRTGHTFTLAVVSIDQLDRTLEQFGQAVAKARLQQFSGEVLQILRTLDSFGRVAANEFAIVMPSTWLESAHKAVRRLKNHLAGCDWQAAGSLSFSTGLTANAHKDTAESMLQRASQALQLARQKGDDQVAEIEAPLPDYDPNA